ncbi:High-copy suppressor of rspA [Kluyvera cryocrescens]|uniref:High-copy suppressor of rspA n=1 Tax=Kluyvera cryocrescens TaxID=580 RepID=A0A485B627_KLUCR|nr:High-copy suppressor of rspA [Kluyvera cryocrescens]
MTEMKARSMAGLPWIAAMAFFMQALDATILNTALPAIAHSLNRSPLAMQSAIISYTLTVAMLIPVSGWLADRFGTRRIFMLAVSLFTLGSLACALSTSLSELVIFRIIQGVGGAMMMPVARLALLRAYPRSELLPVLNFVTMPGLIGPILGPVLGGVFVTWATLALDFPDQHSYRRRRPTVCPQIYAELHHAAAAFRSLGLFAVRL